MQIVGQWAVYGGRAKSGNRALEAENRQNMSHRVCQITRICVEVTPSGNFSPSASNSLLQWVSYEDAFAALAAIGTRVQLLFGLYDQGDDSGRFYHGTRRDPIFNPDVVSRFAGQFMTWYDGLEDKPQLHSWQCGQEVEFDRSGTYTFNKWWNCWQAVRAVMPSTLVRLSSGISLFERIQGELTLNGRLAYEGKAQASNIVLVAHFNGEPWPVIYPEMRDIPDGYPGVQVACDEDRSPNTGAHSDALRRGKEVERAGGLYYGLFTARCTTQLEGSPKPHDRCTWDINGNTGPPNERENLGIEGCFRVWKPENYNQARLLAQHVGSWIGGTNLPVNIDEGGGGDRPPLPKGSHQLLAVINRSYVHAGLLPPGTERMKDDDTIRELIAALKGRWNIQE